MCLPQQRGVLPQKAQENLPSRVNPYPSGSTISAEQAQLNSALNSHWDIPFYKEMQKKVIRTTIVKNLKRTHKEAPAYTSFSNLGDVSFCQVKEKKGTGPFNSFSYIWIPLLPFLNI